MTDQTETIKTTEPTRTEIARAIYEIAQHIESSGNGVSHTTIKELAAYPVFDQATKEDCDKIIFYSEGSRKFSAGWFVRRNPRWQDTFIQRFGELVPDIAEQLVASLLPQRTERYSPRGLPFESIATGDLLLYAVYTKLQWQRWIAYTDADTDVAHELDEQGTTHGDTIRHILGDATRAWLRELEFRCEWAEKAETLRGLDKDQQKMLTDYQKVLPFVKSVPGFRQADSEALMAALYSPEFVEAYCQQGTMDATIRDLTPLPLPDKVPIRYTTTRELLMRFFEFVALGFEDKDSFEYEDALHLATTEAKKAHEESNNLFGLRTYFDGLRKRLGKMMGEQAVTKDEV